MRGSKGVARASGIRRWMPHAAAATLFVGMVLSVVVPSLVAPGVRNVGEAAMVAVVIVTTAMVAWMRSHGAWRPRLSPFGLLLLIATASGVPGLAVHPSPVMWTGLIFFCVLTLRNYVCFVALPRAQWVLQSSYPETVLKWLVIASTIVAVGSLRAASLTNTSLYSTSRLTGEGNNWLNANSSGVYVATGALAAIMARSIPLWLKAILLGMNTYVLLLTQSRTSMLALAAGVIAFIALTGRRVGAVLVAGIALGSYFAIPVLLNTLRTAGIGQISALIERTDTLRADRWSGRKGIIHQAMERIDESPFVGYGFQSGGFENGYLSVAIETGLVGFAAYLAIIFGVVRRSFRLLLTRSSPEMHQLARCTLCLTAFTLVHSFGEKTAPVFQIGLTASNAWAILAGLVFVHTSRHTATARMPKPAGVGGVLTPTAMRARLERFAPE